jgi:hypothetical protein
MQDVLAGSSRGISIASSLSAKVYVLISIFSNPLISSTRYNKKPSSAHLPRIRTAMSNNDNLVLLPILQPLPHLCSPSRKTHFISSPFPRLGIPPIDNQLKIQLRKFLPQHGGGTPRVTRFGAIFLESRVWERVSVESYERRL